jgi:alpha/beta superfamily hydrolase
VAAPESLRLEGPAGPIEAVFESPEGGAPCALAVVCHPHPLYGGALTNKVVHTVARAFVAQGAACLRFNFRGVGASAGSYDEGRGETEDLLAVVRAGQARLPGLPLWLGGFSFGSFVALRGQAAAGAALLVTVAPPIGRWDFANVEAPACPWLVIQGDRDELVDHRQVGRWMSGFAPQASLVLLQGAEHFFHGRLLEVKDAVSAFVAAAQSGARSA